MKAIGYIRVSTTGQADEGVSLDMQAAKIRAWAELHDAELVELVADEGLSAKNTNRPGLSRALELAKRHKAALVVYSLSRLSRSTRDTLELVATLEACGCELVSLSEKIDTSSAGGRMVFRMLAALAEFERELLAERTKAAMQHMKAEGLCVGSVPHGFRRDGDRLVRDEREAGIVAVVRELRATGLTLREIAAELSERGAFNRRGAAFNPESIRAMLAA